MRLLEVPGRLRRTRREQSIELVVGSLESDWVGWVMGLRRFHLVRSREGALFSNEEPIDLADVYEAIFFDGISETRWRRNANSGVAVTVREGDGDVAYCSVIDGVAGLLWGQGDGGAPSAGWSQMSTSRLGSYVAPIESLLERARVELVQREYLDRDADGRACIVDRRLVGFQPIDERST